MNHCEHLQQNEVVSIIYLSIHFFRKKRQQNVGQVFDQKVKKIFWRSFSIHHMWKVNKKKKMFKNTSACRRTKLKFSHQKLGKKTWRKMDRFLCTFKSMYKVKETTFLKRCMWKNNHGAFLLTHSGFEILRKKSQQNVGWVFEQKIKKFCISFYCKKFLHVFF